MEKRLGRYELIKQLGVGGMARVYLGRAVAEGGFERLVAIKVLHEHWAHESEFVAMFLDEARLAARIRHPNVVSTIDVQTSEGQRFLVMDYVEGLPLNAILAGLGKAKQQVPVDVALRVTLDMLAGLHAAHELRDDTDQLLGLVHRDVSPHNLLVGRDGLARITDFGVARAESRLSSTKSGEIKGKVPYMSPEQILSGDVDRRADVYSAGVVVWELLAGRRLFLADNQGQMLRLVTEGAKEPPSTYNPDVPPALDRVCMKAIAPLLRERLASAADFAEELEIAALECGVRVAGARRVAAFVDEAIAREPPSKKVEPADAEPRAVDSKPADAASVASAPSPPASEPLGGIANHSTVATISAIGTPDPPPRRKALVRGIVGGTSVVVGLIVGMILLGKTSSPDPEAKPGEIGAPPGPAAAATTAGFVVAGPLPSLTAAYAASSSTTGVAAAAEVPSSVQASIGPAARAVPSSSVARPPAKKRGGGGAADFLPGEL